MKTAIYVEDGKVQVVITPESDFEKSVISAIEGKIDSAKIFSGAFYDCRGGWVRQTRYDRGVYCEAINDKSLIIHSATDIEIEKR